MFENVSTENLLIQTLPHRYGQYQLSENVSPYVPASFLASLSSAAYQTPANSYEPPKPMPANFNVYTTKNPAPVQYKPAPPVYGQSAGYPIGPPVSYAPAAPQYAPVSYGPPPPPPAISYGVNYEHNKQPVYVPAASPQSYLVPPPHAYPAIPSYMPVLPALPIEIVKPEASKAANETLEKIEEKIDGKVESPVVEPPPPVPADPAKPAVSAISNEAPAVKPIEKPDKKIQGKPTKPTDKKLPLEPAKPPPPAPVVPPRAHVPGYQRTNLTGRSQKFADHRVTGYRYLAQSNRRRSAPTTYGQASPARNQQYYRSSPTYPYPPSVNYSDSANQTTGYYRRAAYQYRTTAAAKDAKRGAAYGPGYSAASPAYGAASPAYGAASPAYGAASPAYSAASPSYSAASPGYSAAKTYYSSATTNYQQQASVYNENNVAESVLRGYSVNPEDNNNKAIVRVFEEVGLSCILHKGFIHFFSDSLTARQLITASFRKELFSATKFIVLCLNLVS